MMKNNKITNNINERIRVIKNDSHEEINPQSTSDDSDDSYSTNVEQEQVRINIKPENVRQGIIYSEILAKPRALRRGRL